MIVKQKGEKNNNNKKAKKHSAEFVSTADSNEPLLHRLGQSCWFYHRSWFSYEFFSSPFVNLCFRSFLPRGGKKIWKAWLYRETQAEKPDNSNIMIIKCRHLHFTIMYWSLKLSHLRWCFCLYCKSTGTRVLLLFSVEHKWFDTCSFWGWWKRTVHRKNFSQPSLIIPP